MSFLDYRLRVHPVSVSVTTRRIQCVSDVEEEPFIFKRRDVRNVLTRVQGEGIVSNSVVSILPFNAHSTLQITGERNRYEDTLLVRGG